MPSSILFSWAAAALRSALISALRSRYADLASLKTLTMCLLYRKVSTAERDTEREGAAHAAHDFAGSVDNGDGLS